MVVLHSHTPCPVHLRKCLMTARGDLDPQTMVSCKLYGRRRLRREVLGSAEKTLGELFEGSSTSVCVYFFAQINIRFPIGADIQLYNGTSEIAVLKISGSSNRRALIGRTRTEH